MNRQNPVPPPKPRWFLEALLIAEVILSAAALLILTIVLLKPVLEAISEMHVFFGPPDK